MKVVLFLLILLTIVYFTARQRMQRRADHKRLRQHQQHEQQQQREFQQETDRLNPHLSEHKWQDNEF